MLTDQPFWEHFWQDKIKIKKIHSWDMMWSRYGAFQTVVRRAGCDFDGKRVIELGGVNSKRLLSMACFGNADVTALDFIENGLKQTEALFQFNGLQVKTVYADMFKWIPEHLYDIVTHWGLLEHFEDPVSVLKVSRRLVHENGYVMFGMPNMKAKGSRLWEKYAPESWSKHIFHSDSVVDEACRDAGLKLIYKTTWGSPVVQIVGWEVDKWWLKALSQTQLALYAAGMIVPLFQFGHPAISMERFFVAQPVKM